MTLAKLFKDRRSALGWSMAKLGEVAALSPTYIMKIEKGHIPTNQVLEKLAKALDLDLKSVYKMVEYERDPKAYELIHGEAEEPVPLLKNLMRYQLIPIIDYTQAGEWREVIDTYQPGQGSDEVPVSSDRSDLIALRVKGNSMEPLIRNGQVVVVDPHRRPNNGDIVIAVKEGQSTIKRLHRVDDTTIILEPLNPAFEKIVLTRQDAEDLRIVGVVIEIKLIV